MGGEVRWILEELGRETIIRIFHIKSISIKAIE